MLGRTPCSMVEGREVASPPSQQRDFFLPHPILSLPNPLLSKALITAPGCTWAWLKKHARFACVTEVRLHWAFYRLQSLWKISLFLNPVRAFEVFSFWSCKSILKKNLSHSSFCFFMRGFPSLVLELLRWLLICRPATGCVTCWLSASSESLLRSHRVTTHPKLPLVVEGLPDCG